jgi:cbb3-type cytochrome oxidase maturation protein
MIFYMFFMIYLAAGILICGALFYWAVKNGQFEDQDRARYFPLSGVDPEPSDASSAKWPKSLVVSVAVLLGALIAQLVTAMVLSVMG